ncbi:cation:proton antiporter [Streptosporangium sp. NBC_01469]|uniref:cation:proton antiporter n=1 Tax=Streptosporangium sp. NBC_01469 TaxID=2903898 RepID=UPI002E2D3971|nr:cation:proton antiporter [Streptosporangium sp. NBC_01469]
MRPETPLEETEQRLMPAPARGVAVAVGLTAAAVLLLVVVGLSVSPSAAHQATAGAAHASSPIQLAARLFLAIAVIGGLASLGGMLARRVGQPPVIGEIMAGLVLGPSVLGSLAPGVVSAVLPATILPHLNLIAQASLALFMFTVGAEFDHGVLGRQRGVIGAASQAMMVVPFALGVVAALPLFDMFAGDSVGLVPFAIFVGTALSVTAFPVLARIVQETGLGGTRLGSLAMICAAVADVLAWCALAVVLAILRAEGASGVVVALSLTAALCAVLLLVVRPALRTLALRYAHVRLPAPVCLGLVLGLVFALASITDLIGVHAIFGGFLAGIVLPREARALGTMPARLGTFNQVLLLPVFFASIGLQVDVRFAVTHPGVLLGGALLLVVAILGKLGSAWLVTLAGGMPPRLALGLGVLMNARGITEIVVLSSGLSIGVINGNAFTVLVIMALVTTVMTVPSLRLLGLTRPAAGRPPASERQVIATGEKEFPL